MGVEGNVAGVAAGGGDGVDEGDFFGGGVEGVGADAAAWGEVFQGAGVAGVDVFAVGVDDEVGGSGGFEGEDGFGEGAGFGIEVGDGEAEVFAGAVGAEEDVVVGGGGSGGERGNKDERQCAS